MFSLITTAELILLSIVIGASNGQFSSIFKKVSALQSKNNFSFAIVVGDLFGDPNTLEEGPLDGLLEGRLPIPLPTYFTLGSHALPERVTHRLAANNNEV